MIYKDYSIKYNNIKKEYNTLIDKLANFNLNVEVKEGPLKGLELEKAFCNQKLDRYLRLKNKSLRLKNDFDLIKEEYANKLFEYYKNKNYKILNLKTKEIKRFNELFQDLNKNNITYIIDINEEKNYFKIKHFIF